MKSFWSKEYETEQFYISGGLEFSQFNIGIIFGRYYLTISLYPFVFNISYETKKQLARWEEIIKTYKLED